MLDFLLTFITVVEVNGRLQTKLGNIALNYLKGWFVIDLFSCFPYDLLTPDSSNNLK